MRVSRSKCTLSVYGLARAVVNAPASVRSLTVARNVSDAVRDRARRRTTRVYVIGTGVGSSSRLLAGSESDSSDEPRGTDAEDCPPKGGARPVMGVPYAGWLRFHDPALSADGE